MDNMRIKSYSELSQDEIVRCVLERRGVLDETSWQAINDETHELLGHVDELTDMLEQDIVNGNGIVILPDFDMDGISSATVLYVGLSLMGANVNLFVPNPSEGYGFNADTINRLVTEFPACRTLITCDTGISCVDGVKRANELGLSVLVTDHHEESPTDTVRGLADIIVNPCATDSTYEHREICGAFVAYQCMCRLADRFHADVTKYVRLLGVFAGIGTISDSMPLLYENRLLVMRTVKTCNMLWSHYEPLMSLLSGAPEPLRYAFRGLHVVHDAFVNVGKAKPVNLAHRETEEFFGFYMTPAFNAMKRLNQDMGLAYGMFVDKVADSYISAKGENHVMNRTRWQRESMITMVRVNERRKALVDRTMVEIREGGSLWEQEPYAYVLPSDTPRGILGLIAMQMTKKSGLPCVVLAMNDDGTLAGSGRSPDWFPMLDTVRGRISGVRLAGHQGAFGISANSVDSLERLASFVSQLVHDAIIKAEEDGKLSDGCDFNVDLSDECTDIHVLSDELLGLAYDIESLRPFGRGFEKPTIRLRLPTNRAWWKQFGTDGRHLKATVMNSTIDCISWNNGATISNGVPAGHVSFLGTPEINEYNGKVKPQLTGDVSFES